MAAHPAFGPSRGRPRRSPFILSGEFTIEQHTRADDICVNEIKRIVDAAVDMRFGREIDNRIKLMLGHERIHLVGIGDVGLEKFVAITVFFDHAVKICGVPGVGEDVDVTDQRRFVVLQDVTDEIAANKSAPAGYQNSHSGR